MRKDYDIKWSDIVVGALIMIVTVVGVHMLAVLLSRHPDLVPLVINVFSVLLAVQLARVWLRKRREWERRDEKKTPS